VDALVRLMATSAETTGPLNLGNTSEYPIRELAETVLRLTGSRSKLITRPLPVDDPKQRQPDITVAREALDWQPRVRLEDGLKETIAYFRRIM